MSHPATQFTKHSHPHDDQLMDGWDWVGWTKWQRNEDGGRRDDIIGGDRFGY